MSGQFTDHLDRPSTIVFPHQTAQAVCCAIFLLGTLTIRPEHLSGPRTLILLLLPWCSICDDIRNDHAPDAAVELFLLEILDEAQQYQDSVHLDLYRQVSRYTAPEVRYVWSQTLTFLPSFPSAGCFWYLRGSYYTASGRLQTRKSSPTRPPTYLGLTLLTVTRTSCVAAIVACITFYFISKIFISLFLLERVSLSRDHRVIRSAHSTGTIGTHRE